MCVKSGNEPDGMREPWDICMCMKSRVKKKKKIKASEHDGVIEIKRAIAQPVFHSFSVQDMPHMGDVMTLREREHIILGC